MASIYAATMLPPSEWEVLCCLHNEQVEGASQVTFAYLRQTYQILEDFTDEELSAAIGSLTQKGYISQLFPDGSTMTITKLGADVVQFKESTAQEVD